MTASFSPRHHVWFKAFPDYEAALSQNSSRVINPIHLASFYGPEVSHVLNRAFSRCASYRYV